MKFFIDTGNGLVYHVVSISYFEVLEWPETSKKANFTKQKMQFSLCMTLLKNTVSLMTVENT